MLFRKKKKEIAQQIIVFVFFLISCVLIYNLMFVICLTRLLNNTVTVGKLGRTTALMSNWNVSSPDLGDVAFVITQIFSEGDCLLIYVHVTFLI